MPHADKIVKFKFKCAEGLVARSLVSANRWLRGIKMYRFPWYLTLVSTNHASSNPGQVVKIATFLSTTEIIASISAV